MTLENLRRARLAAGLSTTQAGQLIGKSQSVYSKIERGAIGLDARDALTLCDRFGLSLESLLSQHLTST